MKNLKNNMKNFVANEGILAEIYMILKNDLQFFLREMDIKEDNQKELTTSFIAFINDNIIDNKDASLLKLTNHDVRNNVIYEYDYSSYPNDFYIFDLLNTIDDIPKFDFGSDDIKSLRGFLVRMIFEENELILYKQHYPTSYVGKENKKGIPLFNIGNRFEIFESNIIRFNNNVDFFRFNGKFYILNMKVLERFFQFHSVIKMHALESIEKIKTSEIIENPEALFEMAENITFARKLVKVGTSSPVLGIIPNSEIINFIKQQPNLKTKINFNSKEDQIVLDTNISIETFVKILNDDYLISQLTNHFYESLAKDEVK